MNRIDRRLIESRFRSLLKSAPDGADFASFWYDSETGRSASIASSSSIGELAFILLCHCFEEMSKDERSVICAELVSAAGLLDEFRVEGDAVH